MRDTVWGLLVMFLVLPLSGTTLAQTKPKNQTLVINGRPGEAAVVQVNGRAYVDLQALTRVVNGTLAFSGNQVILTLPASGVSAPPPAPEPEFPTNSGLSRDFMKAGIEVIALMREWASPLAYAIQNGYPVTENWVAGYQAQAARGLRLASVAASTDSDRNALQLLTNEFEAVREWSNKLVEARKSMDAAKYAMSASTLQNDPLSQKIVTCAHFLAPMLGSGEYQDNASCH